MVLFDDIDGMLLSELRKSADYKHDTSLRYPQTKSEHIVAEALGLLLSQDWVDDDPLLEEITSVLSQLDTGVDRPKEWRELKRLTKELRRREL